VLQSIRTRVLALFLLSVTAFAGAALYVLSQLRAIGEGLDSINAGYIPIAEEVAQIEAMARQLQRENDRSLGEEPSSIRTETAKAYLGALREDIQAARTLVTLMEDAGHLAEERESFRKTVELLEAIDSQAQGYQSALSLLEKGETDRALSQLHRHQAGLTLRVGQLAAMISDRVQKMGAQTAQARSRAYIVGGALAGLAAVLSVLLTLVALRILHPIAMLTAQVQKLAAGDYTDRIGGSKEGMGLEVAVLAREINAMAEAVAERDRRLSERAEALDRLSLRLQQVLDTMRTGLLVIEGDGAAMVNPAATKQWKVEAGEPAPEDLLRFRDGRHEEIPIGGALYDIDVSPLGTGAKLLAVEDITQRVRDREKLARAEQLALVGRMLAQITHEVRNPLNAMSLNAEMLSDESLSEEGQEIMAMITNEIHRLERITERYLSLSRRREASLTQTDPLQIAREVVFAEEALLKSMGVECQIEGGASQLWTDPEALRSAVRNLIRNSVEAGASEVAIRGIELDGSFVLTVADNGDGMNEESMERAFELFHTTKAKGTGLGLAICRQEIEALGGSMGCSSVPGEGSVFRLTLPTENDNLS
jgi:signal transduction histidine kinase